MSDDRWGLWRWAGLVRDPPRYKFDSMRNKIQQKKKEEKKKRPMAGLLGHISLRDIIDKSAVDGVGYVDLLASTLSVGYV